MASQPVVFDAVVPEMTQGAMPMDAPPAVAAESANAFQHVAVMKEDDVSTVGFDSNDWELVAEMVVDAENFATEFLQSRHMVDLEVLAGNLEESFKSMEDYLARLNLGTAAGGVAPSKPEGLASAAAAASTVGDPPL